MFPLINLSSPLDIRLVHVPRFYFFIIYSSFLSRWVEVEVEEGGVVFQLTQMFEELLCVAN